jgi:hypothetical protein
MKRLKLWAIESAARYVAPCNQITHKLSQGLDRKLTLREWLTVKLHLFICVWCTRYGEQIALIKDSVHDNAVAAEQATAPTTPLPEGVSERLKKSLRDQS